MRASDAVTAGVLLLAGCGAAPYDVGFHLSGTFALPSPAPRIELLDNVGALTLGSESLPAVAPLTVAPRTPGHTVVEIIATAERDLAVVFLDCNDGRATSGLFESLGSPPASFELADGTPCPIETRTHNVPGQALRPFRAAPDGFTPSRRATIAGTTSPPGLALGPDGTGHIEATEVGKYHFEQWQMTAFGFVDCSTCGTAGWSEVHVLLTLPDGGVAVAILYLMADAPGSVLMSSGLRLDHLANMASVTFPATWEIH